MICFLNRLLFSFTNILTSPIGYLVSMFMYNYIKYLIFVMNTNIIITLSIINLFRCSIKKFLVTCGGIYLQYLCYEHYTIIPTTFFFINYVIITMFLSHFQSVWLEATKDNSLSYYKAKRSFENLHNYLVNMALFPYIIITIRWITKH